MELSDVNTTIVTLEDQLTDEYRKGLEARLEQRRSELKAQDEAKPSEVKEPSQDPQEQEATEVVKRELAELVGQSPSVWTSKFPRHGSSCVTPLFKLRPQRGYLLG